MKLIIGLGNPGEKYKKTRHNLGFMVVDALAKNLSVTFSYDQTFNADVATARDAGKHLIIAKPKTFMNDSGFSVQALQQYYKIPIEHIFVIHDDLDLEFGVHKITKDSGAGGHHGIESIIQHLDSKAFQRIKLGIADEILEHIRKENKEAVADFVTSDFTKEEKEKLDKLINDVVDLVLISVAQ